MSRKNRGHGASGPERILALGEDVNDARVIRSLLGAMHPGLEKRVEARQVPVVLVKNSSPANFPSRAGKIAALIRAENARRPVRATFLHEDCDEVEPAHERVAKTIEESSLAKSHHIHAVTPAWEMESWVFLWPEAVTAYRPSWKLSNSYRSRSTGMIANAKETLTRDLDSNSPGRGTPKYRESDLPGIMEKVRTEGLIDQRRAQSRSFDAFRDAAACPTCDLRTLAESP